MVSGNSWLDATGSGEVILAYCDMNTEGLELFLFTPLLKENCFNYTLYIMAIPSMRCACRESW